MLAPGVPRRARFRPSDRPGDRENLVDRVDVHATPSEPRRVGYATTSPGWLTVEASRVRFAVNGAKFMRLASTGSAIP